MLSKPYKHCALPTRRQHARARAEERVRRNIAPPQPCRPLEPFKPTLKRGDFPKVQYTSYSSRERVLPPSNTYPSSSIRIDDFKSSLYSKPSFDGRVVLTSAARLQDSLTTPQDYIQAGADHSFRAVTLKRPRTSCFPSYLYSCLCARDLISQYYTTLYGTMMYALNCPRCCNRHNFSPPLSLAPSINYHCMSICFTAKLCSFVFMISLARNIFSSTAPLRLQLTMYSQLGVR